MKTLIVVSDDPQVISVAGQLTWCGVIVLDESLKGLANSTWNTVVLLDLAYPNIIEVIRRYIDREHHVLLVAEPGHDAEIANFLENGGDDYLLKPLHPALLEKRVRRIVDVTRVDEFMAFGAMEIKNSLSPITGWVDIILQVMNSQQTHLPAERIPEWLDIIRTSAIRTEYMINDLTAIAKLDAGQKLYVDTQPVDIIPLITGVLSVFKRKIDEHELRLILDLPEMLPQVNADTYRLHQLLTNLISNAVKYSGYDEPDETLTISARPAGDFLQISIRDQGIGMKVDDIERAFAQDGKSSGTVGMGLRISKAIVHAHGGEIWAENNADKGITVHFTLPIAKNQANS